MPRRDPRPPHRRYSVVDGCWLWDGCTDDLGYGRMYHPEKKRSYLAHRYMFERHHRRPAADTLDHTCRTPGCINPAHLVETTRQENVRIGARAKLTHEAARAIRESSDRAVDLAVRFGVSRSTISNVRAGRVWAEA